jgi:hypothetical protein
MKKTFTILLLTIFLAGVIQAQKNQFQIGIGYQRTWMVDKQASPLKYQTSERTFSLGYFHTGSKAKFNVQLNGSFGDFFPTGFHNRQLYNPGYNNNGTPKKDSFPFVGTLYNARIKVAYLKQVSNGYSVIGKEKLYSNNYVGASLNNQLFYSDNFVRTGWFNSSSVNPEFEHAAVYNTRHSINIKISIPLFARNTRLPYHNSISSPEGDNGIKSFFKQGSPFGWFGNFQNIQLDAGYEYSVSNHVGLGMHYFGQWLHYNYEKPITLFQNNIGVTASLK